MNKINKLIAVCLVFSFLLTGCGQPKPELPPDPRVEQYQQITAPYLEDYAAAVDFTQGLDDAAFGNTENVRVFLSGETYFQTASYEAKKLLLQYLHEHQGVDYLMLEDSIGIGLLMDRYLETGSAELLKTAMEGRKSYHSGTKEEDAFWRWLYDYNAQQQEGEKLHVIGLDFECQANSEFLAIGSLLLPEVEPHPGLKVWYEKFTSGDTMVRGQANGELFYYMSKYPEEIQKLFGDNYTMVLHIRNNMSLYGAYFNGIKMGKTPEAVSNIRENALYQNFLFYLKQLPEDAKFFGQFQDVRVFQKCFETSESGENVGRFAQRLNGDGSPVEGEVCSILCVPIQGKGDTAVPLTETYFWLPMGLFANCFSQDTFLSLNEEGSSFTASGEELGLTDYFQKMLFVTSSKKTTLY